MPNPRRLDTVIERCAACPFAAYWAKGALDNILNGHRLYVGCSKVKRPFGYGTNPFEPGEIPEWCPLPKPEARLSSDINKPVSLAPDPNVKAPALVVVQEIL